MILYHEAKQIQKKNACICEARRETYHPAKVYHIIFVGIKGKNQCSKIGKW